MILRPVTTPVGITAGFDILVSGDAKGGLMEDLVYNGEYNINVDFMTGNVLGMNYQLSGLRLDSVQYDSSIGSNKTASLSFSSDFSLDDNFGDVELSFRIESFNYLFENDYYNKIATCVLTDCQVDYTPGGVRSFDDGSPTQIKMSLSFMETQLLTKELIAQGY